MMRIGSIRPEYEFDDEDSIDLACFYLHKADVFVQWILAFFWIFKAFVQDIVSVFATTTWDYRRGYGLVLNPRVMKVVDRGFNAWFSVVLGV
ncbi:hypothetical protein F2Q70_00000490 [Brassica cretica]|uniref:Uncharacterized protein n=1 Tax=Brassica cretica TaxID=69181 RepID=A0A3N6TKN2_BRACR|nr:hypothetical protein F2Q70_00000490 [Brassica cretica]KAF3568985.1 hypothetical protein DY000_02011482 [Brassica cretica]